MKTIQTDVIVRKALKQKKNKAVEDLSTFDELAWCCLCELAYKHTVLVDAISERIKQNPTLINWIRAAQDSQSQDSITTDTDTETEKRQGSLPKGLVKGLYSSLENTPQFKGMSGRFYTSAAERVEEIFKAWFASHQKLIRQIRGKRRWLAIIETDAQLAETSNSSQQEIENKAREILAGTQAGSEADGNSRDRIVFNALFKKFDETDDVLSRRAIIYLLRNGGKVQEEPKKSRQPKRRKPDEPSILLERIEAKRVEIERLEKQLISELPRARNLFPDWAFEESLGNLLALPDLDLAKCSQYYFLVFLLLTHCSGSDQYAQFKQHLLKRMELQCQKMGSLLYYQVLFLSFLLHITSLQKYLQLAWYLLQMIKVESEQIESQFLNWHDSITLKREEFLREPKSLPYPISFGYDSVRAWQTNKEGKIFFKLNGWNDLIFEVRCSRRHLPLIKTFLKDWQTKNKSENRSKYTKYTGSFMLLCSIELVWKPEKTIKPSDVQLCSKCEIFQQYSGKGFWDECKLSIHWTYDSDALTKQGLERIRQRKLEPQLEQLRKKREKLEEKQELLSSLEQEVPETSRSKIQIKRIENLKEEIQKLQADLAKPRPELERLQNSPLFDRPDRPLYEGIPNIFVGVLLDLDKHIVVTIVDAMRRKILAIRNARSISEEGYNLLQKYFRQRREHSRHRQENQRAARHLYQTESGLGQQVARLFAKGLVKLAQEYKASTIVIPETGGWRNRLYSQLVAKARIKCNGSKKAMKKYTKEHGEKLHQWDYNRLSKAIVDCAATNNLRVILQRVVFEEDAFQQAASLAIATYDSLRLPET